MSTQASTQPPGTRPRRSRFERLADWAYSHRRRALLAWVAVLVGVTAASSAVGSDYHNDFSLPGTESQQAVDTLQARAPAQAGDTVQVVFQDPEGLQAPAVRDRVALERA
jgi:putative drug exporter of the RND superfamily